MITKHEIIRQLYSKAGPIIGNEDGTFIVKDDEGNVITIDLDAVNTEFAKQEYKNKRFTGRATCAQRGIEVYYNRRDHRFSTSDLRERVFIKQKELKNG